MNSTKIGAILYALFENFTIMASGQCQAQRVIRIKTFRKLKYAVKTDPGVARTGQGPTENMCPSTSKC